MRKILLIILGIFLVFSFLAYGFNSPLAYGAPPAQTTPTPDDAPVVDDAESVASRDYAGAIFSGGVNRQYFLHIPIGYDENTPLPLLISYHGFTSNPFENAQRTGFSELADEEDFIVVYPAGWQPTPDDPIGWFSHEGAEEEFVDDVRFTRDLITYLRANYAIDPARIYITGFSNGGGMAHRVGCDMSEEVAAVTAAGGTHIDEDLCEPTRAIPILGLHGRDDDVTPYIGIRGLLEAIPEWAMEWAQRNGCNLEPAVETSDNLTIEQWNDCTAEATVMLYTWDVLGHRWPPNGAQIVWDFLKDYTLPQAYVDAQAEANNISKPGDYGITLTSGGAPRSFVLHVPETYDGSVAYPVLISFHDYGSSAVGNIQSTTLTTSTEDFIVVFPEGRGNPLAWFTEAEAPENFPTDTQFFTDIVTRLQDDLAIDPAQVYVTGFSLGGGMVHRLGCNLADEVAGLAIVNGAHWLGQTCDPTQPVPVLAIHTLDNESVPLAGYPDTLQAIPEWALEWAEYNGCDAEPIAETLANGVTVSTWQNCTAPVQLYVYEAGGHEWSSEFNTVILSFFSSLVTQ